METTELVFTIRSYFPCPSPALPALFSSWYLAWMLGVSACLVTFVASDDLSGFYASCVVSSAKRLAPTPL